MFPKLLLRKAGALLAPQDPVGDVLSTDEEVQAEIQGWDLPPLPERYRRVCASLGLAPSPLLLKVTELQGPSSALAIPAGIRLLPAQLPALLRALKLQEPLRELRLRSHGIAAAAVAELGALLATVPRLALLDLAGTGIGPRGLRSLGAQPDAFQVAELGALLATVPRLALLDLAGTGIGPRGLRSLGAQPDAFQVAELGALLATVPRLALLDLAGTGIGPRGLRSLGAQPDAFQVAELGALLATVPRLALLDLAGTGIGPRGLRSLGAQPDAFQVAELGALLATVPRLALLDLAGTGIGPRGLRSLGAQPDAFQSLQELDLSLNPLGACGGRALAELLAQCPALVTLHVRGCGLTEPFPIPELCPLRTLSLSCNVLAPALGRLLPMIPARSIRRLELASVSGRGDGAGAIAGAIAGYLEQDGCALSHLSLAGNHLGDGDIQEVARSLARCPSLVALELSANPGIGAGSLRILLEALEKRSRGLEFLSLAGCGVRELDEATWSRSTAQIRDLRLPGRRLWKGP